MMLAQKGFAVLFPGLPVASVDRSLKDLADIIIQITAGCGETPRTTLADVNTMINGGDRCAHYPVTPVYCVSFTMNEKIYHVLLVRNEDVRHHRNNMLILSSDGFRKLVSVADYVESVGTILLRPACRCDPGSIIKRTVDLNKSFTKFYNLALGSDSTIWSMTSLSELGCAAAYHDAPIKANSEAALNEGRLTRSGARTGVSLILSLMELANPKDCVAHPYISITASARDIQYLEPESYAGRLVKTEELRDTPLFCTPINLEHGTFNLSFGHIGTLQSYVGFLNPTSGGLTVFGHQTSSRFQSVFSGKENGIIGQTYTPCTVTKELVSSWCQVLPRYEKQPNMAESLRQEGKRQVDAAGSIHMIPCLPSRMYGPIFCIDDAAVVEAIHWWGKYAHTCTNYDNPIIGTVAIDGSVTLMIPPTSAEPSYIVCLRKEKEAVGSRYLDVKTGNTHPQPTPAPYETVVTAAAYVMLQQSYCLRPLMEAKRLAEATSRWHEAYRATKTAGRLIFDSTPDQLSSAIMARLADLPNVTTGKLGEFQQHQFILAAIKQLLSFSDGLFETWCRCLEMNLPVTAYLYPGNIEDVIGGIEEDQKTYAITKEDRADMIETATKSASDNRPSRGARRDDGNGPIRVPRLNRSAVAHTAAPSTAAAPSTTAPSTTAPSTAAPSTSSSVLHIERHAASATRNEAVVPSAAHSDIPAPKTAPMKSSKREALTIRRPNAAPAAPTAAPATTALSIAALSTAAPPSPVECHTSEHEVPGPVEKVATKAAAPSAAPGAPRSESLASTEGPHPATTTSVTEKPHRLSVQRRGADAGSR